MRRSSQCSPITMGGERRENLCNVTSLCGIRGVEQVRQRTELSDRREEMVRIIQHGSTVVPLSLKFLVPFRGKSSIRRRRTGRDRDRDEESINRGPVAASRDRSPAHGFCSFARAYE